MTDYKVEIDRVIKKGVEGRDKTEIWAYIKNLKTSESEKKLIWWEDEHGVFHDETPNLAVEFRDIVDNAWIEKRRQW